MKDEVVRYKRNGDGDIIASPNLCQVCGGPMEMWHPDRKYCSLECYALRGIGPAKRPRGLNEDYWWWVLPD